MRLNPPQLAGHLARGLAPMYVVGGEEPLLITESLDAIRAAARKAGFAERQVLEADRTFNWQQVADACASLSLFADKRVIEVRLLGSGPGTEGSQVLKQIAKNPLQDVLLIVVGTELDGSARSSAWFTAIESAGASVYAWPVKGNEFSAWVAARLRAAKVDAEDEAIKLLAERTEGNLLAAAQDIEKLRLLFPNQRVTAQALAEAVVDSSRYEAFDLSERMLAGDAAGAVRSLERMREEGVNLLEILGALAWSLRLLAKAAVVMTSTGSADSACERAGVRRNQAGVYVLALNRVRVADTLDWVARTALIDQAVKSGREASGWEDLLTLILAASGAERNRKRA
jgi:DNA polymerase-3 subunit delta